ncbi:DUF1345 domain-containing protein [Microbacterium caowuchunii]|uniref:DUF1345 domain-containing protein n=1 Tax=Microbacterium caowuchunii TaxID=2614638 RepID=UPI001247065F|nr:DUF1345 domain-containing protein [Microbacterium caowuchunii]QEV98949.1 DUF1345 domain-containing protein [Microbacterium caowuchunii]
MTRGPGAFQSPWHRAGTRVGVVLAVFVLVTVTAGAPGTWPSSPAIGWIAAAGTYCLWEWTTVFRLDARDTAGHATREDPTRPVAEALLIVATFASLGAILLLLLQSGSVQGTSAFVLAGTAVITVTASWFLVHVLFALRYAALYYGAGGTGVDFNQPEPPQYRDFAYLAFTLGMTYQVSDTSLTTPAFRRQVLRHALLSYLLGGVVIASAVNLIASLAR